MSAGTEQSNFPKGGLLGPYEIASSIGAGGMGEVFRARDTRLNRDVAVKVLPKDFTTAAVRAGGQFNVATVQDLRSNPRNQALLRKMNLVPEALTVIH